MRRAFFHAEILTKLVILASGRAPGALCYGLPLGALGAVGIIAHFAGAWLRWRFFEVRAFMDGVRVGGRAFWRLLWVFVRRDVREQYAGTMMGNLWALAQPALLVLIYWWVFSVVWSLKVPGMGARAADEVSFIVFLLSALLPWLAFQDAVNKAAGALLARADVLRHGQFPAEIFVLARVLAAHGVYAVLLVVYVIFGRGQVVLEAPLVLPGLALLFAVQVVSACAVGLLVAAFSVYLRDLPHVLSMALMAVFFTAPVLFPMAQVPEHLQRWVWVNPFTAFSQGYHMLLLGGQWPSWGVWVFVLMLAAVLCWLGWAVFVRLRPGFADVL